MRSLDEVRADLARLRETAKERHALAQQQVRRVDTSFARTDFMEIPEPLPMPRKKVDPEFEATAFAGIPAPLPKPRKKDDSGFEPTAFTDFSDFAYPIPLLAR